MTYAIRPARPADEDAIVGLAIESVSRSPIPVVIDREGIRELVRETIPGRHHFVWVGVEDGAVVACVGAQVTPGWWFQRSQASVLLFYTRRPGYGIALIREFARWVKSRPTIKMALFSLEHDADPRIGKLLRRLGFTLEHPQFTYVRGM